MGRSESGPACFLQSALVCTRAFANGHEKVEAELLQDSQMARAFANSLLTCSSSNDPCGILVDYEKKLLQIDEMFDIEIAHQKAFSNEVGIQRLQEEVMKILPSESVEVDFETCLAGLELL